MVEVNS